MSEASESPRTPLAVALADGRAAVDLGVEVAGDYGDPFGEYLALRSQAGMVDRSARGAVLVSGPDALGFLHSLLSQDVAGLADGQGSHCLLLLPQGKLDVDVRLLRVGDECWLDCEVGLAPRLVASLNRYRIRVKAIVEDRSHTFGMLSLKGEGATARVAEVSGAEIPDTAHAHVGWGGLRVVRADWPELPGVDVIGPVDELTGAWGALVEAGVMPAGLAAYESVRVEAGVPRQGRDLDESTIPQEAFLERDAVSFTKGCFLGQELVCRIDTRGHVNRLLRGLRFEGPDQPPVGAEVWRGERRVGALTSVAPLLRPALALGFVRREVEPGEVTRVAWTGSEATARVVELPGVA